MRRNDTALYICLGLLCLGIASLWIDMKPSIIARISVSMLIFSIAQVVESTIDYNNVNTRNALEVFGKINKHSITEEQMMFMKSYILNFDTDKKKQRTKVASSVLYCTAFAILFLGFVIPVQINQNLNAAVTIVSASVIFLSMWIAEKSIRKTELWDEVLKLAVLIPQSSKMPNGDIHTPETADPEENDTVQ